VSGAGERPALPPSWSGEAEATADFELAMHVGGSTFQKLPLVTDPAELARREVDVAVIGAPMDEGDTNRPGARFGPRAIRLAQYNTGSIYAQELGLNPFEVLTVVDGGDALVEPPLLDHNHTAIHRKASEVVGAGVVPITLGGDHSTSWPTVLAVARHHWPERIGMIHFDAHTDTGGDGLHTVSTHGKPMRRLVEAGAVRGSDFVQIGLRGYWPPREVFEWMDGQGFHRHHMSEIVERGLGPVLDDAIAAATAETSCVYLSIDVDVLEPAMAPGTGTPEPGGLLTRELLGAIRRVAREVRLAGVDVVEVSPAYDVAEVTATTAHRCALEAISGIAARRADGAEVRFPAA
jgi:agmatinase